MNRIPVCAPLNNFENASKEVDYDPLPGGFMCLGPEYIRVQPIIAE